MSWGFIENHYYDREKDIHQKYGGQEQSGIITPKNHNIIFLVTNSNGKKYGYDDCYIMPTGEPLVSPAAKSNAIFFKYYGQGRSGDMQLTRGNKAVYEHSKDGKSLLLFENKNNKMGWRFVGEMILDHIGYETIINGKESRQAIVFFLASLNDINEQMLLANNDYPSESHNKNFNIDDLREKAYGASINEPSKQNKNISVIERCYAVKKYVYERANGLCEGCGQPAPFLRKDNTPYLETHHVRRLSDGGPDIPSSVIALCPTCHRLVHSGINGDSYNNSLIEKLKKLEGIHK